MQDQTGRCVSCGYLAKRAYDRRATFNETRFDREYLEVDPQEREQGEASWYSDPDQGNIQAAPFCFRQVLYFDPSVFKETILEDRHCVKWGSYTPGFSPREHYEEAQMLQLEQMRREQMRWNLGLTFLAVLVAAIGIGLSAYFNMQAAERQADATERAADRQIQASQTAAPLQPPINITIAAPVAAP